MELSNHSYSSWLCDFLSREVLIYTHAYDSPPESQCYENFELLDTTGDVYEYVMFWQIKKGWNLFEMPTKNDVFFSAASCKKDIIFGGHLKQILSLLISLGL